MTDTNLIQRKFDRERAARKEAERLLEEKSRDLYHAHLEVEKTAEAFRDSAARLSAIMDNVPAAIVTLAENGVIESCNRETEAKFGCSWSTLVGQPVSKLFQEFVTPDGSGEPTLPKILKLELGVLREATCLRSDGSTFPSEFALTEVKHADAHYWIVFLRDITKRKEAEKRRADLEIEVRQAQKMEALGTLSGGIAHEINTPVQYLGDNLRFLQDAFNDLSTLLEKAEVVGAAIESGNDITEELNATRAAAEEIDLDFLKAEVPASITNGLEGVTRISEIVRAIKMFSHPDQKEMTPVDLNEAIRTTATVTRNHWKHIAELVYQLEPDLPPVWGLPGEINQVILNLIMNAAHAIEDSKRGGTGEILITTRQNGPSIEFSIQDSGVGIPEENLSKIFEPFFTTKEPGRGTGQGMSIVHTIVTKKHRGGVAIASKVGEGTTITVSLPACADNAVRMAS